MTRLTAIGNDMASARSDIRTPRSHAGVTVLHPVSMDGSPEGGDRVREDLFRIMPPYALSDLTLCRYRQTGLMD